MIMMNTDPTMKAVRTARIGTTAWAQDPPRAGQCAPPISMPDVLERRIVALEDAHDLAAVHDGDPIADGEDLLELGAHDQDGRAGIALLDDPLVDVLDRSDVEAAGRLGRDDQLDRP